MCRSFGAIPSIVTRTSISPSAGQLFVALYPNGIVLAGVELGSETNWAAPDAYKATAVGP
jgi:hypothetical protein